MVLNYRGMEYKNMFIKLQRAKYVNEKKHECIFYLRFRKMFYL